MAEFFTFLIVGGFIVAIGVVGIIVACSLVTAAFSLTNYAIMGDENKNR